jgi:hypothetical protein
VLTFGAALFAVSGAAMAGWLAIANDQDAAHWRALGRVYGVLFVLLVVGFLGAAFAFVRRWRRDRAGNPERSTSPW